MSSEYTLSFQLHRLKRAIQVIKFLKCDTGTKLLNINILTYYRYIAPMLKNYNLSYTAQNHSSIKILKQFVYRYGR